MKRAAILAVIAAILAAPATVAAQPATPITGAALVPDTYAWFVGLTAGPNLPDDLGRLRSGLLGLPTDANTLVETVLDTVFPGAGIDYATDVAPWLGADIAAGLNDEMDYVVLAATNNTQLSDTFVQKMVVYLTGQGMQVSPLIHQGVIVYASDTVGLATFNGYVAFGPLAGVQRAIDVSAEQANGLTTSPGFQQAVSGLPADALVTIYLSGAAIQMAMVDFGFDLGPLLGATSVTGVGFSISPHAQTALRLDVSLGLSEPVQGPVLNTPSAGSAVTEALPEDTLGFFTSYDLRLPVRLGLSLFALQSYLQGALDALATGAPAPTPPAPDYADTMVNGLLATANLTLSSQLGATINIESNILNWMSGEYAVGLLRNPAGLFGRQEIPADVVALAQVIDRNATLNTIEILSRLMTSQFELVPMIVNVGGHELRAVSDPTTGGNLFVFGLVGDFLVLATGESVQQIVAVANGATPILASSVRWQENTRGVEPASEALLYFPVSEYVSYVRSSLTGDLLNEFETYNAPALEPYDFFVASVDVRDESGLIVLTALVGTK